MLRDRYAPYSLFAAVPQRALQFEPELAHLDRLLDDEPLSGWCATTWSGATRARPTGAGRQRRWRWCCGCWWSSCGRAKPCPSSEAVSGILPRSLS
jgi:hypothetical protein